MTVRLITPPAALPVTMAEAKEALRIDDDALDITITAWITGITAFVQHAIGRALINQTWRVTLDQFPEAIELANPPTVSVLAVRFLDANGVQQTLDPADYKLDAVSEPGYVVPARGTAWPETIDEINAVEVDFVCGYGPTAASVPDGIRLYILSKLIEQFDSTARPERVSVQSTFTDHLLDPFKVYA